MNLSFSLSNSNSRQISSTSFPFQCRFLISIFLLLSLLQLSIIPKCSAQQPAAAVAAAAVAVATPTRATVSSQGVGSPLAQNLIARQRPRKQLQSSIQRNPNPGTSYYSAGTPAANVLNLIRRQQASINIMRQAANAQIQRSVLGHFPSEARIRAAIQQCLGIRFPSFSFATYFSHGQFGGDRLRFVILDPHQSNRNTQSWLTAYHGTKNKSVPSILQKGLVVGCQPNVPCAHGAMVGTGIYASSRIDVTDAYVERQICPFPNNRLALEVVFELKVDPQFTQYFVKRDFYSAPSPRAGQPMPDKPILKISKTEAIKLQAMIIKTYFV